MQPTKLAPRSWSVLRAPLGWTIYQGTKTIAHTTVALGEVEGESIALQIIKAPDMQAALDAALQAGTVFLPLCNT
jgi:hypothetical protein